MEASHKITYDAAITSITVAVSLPSSDGDLTITATTCDCGFFKSMILPCRHILFFRRQSLLSEYSPDLSAYRWTKAYYRKSHVVFDESQQPENNIQLTTTPRRRRVRVLSAQDKYRRVQGTTQQLARLVSDMPMRQFNEHVQKLEQIVDLLKDGKEYNVQDVHQDDILADTITTPLNPIVEICQDNEDGDDHRGSLQMDDVASITSQSVHDNAEPHITALELATRIQDQFSRASSSSTATNGNTSQNDESHHDSTHDNGVTSSDDFKLLTEPSDKLPPKMIRRGRPKGAETTVVGLPRRTKRIMSFLKRRPKEKEEAMLSWILKSEVNLTSVMDGNVTILKDDIKLHHMLPTKILDENINIARVKKYFSPEAWQTLKVALSSKRDIADWNCTVCDTDVHSAASLVCDGCLGWFHQKCVGLRNAPKTTYWICIKCHCK